MNKKEKRPRIKKVKTRITTDYRGHYVSVNIDFLNGTSHSINFPCDHSPFYHTIRARAVIVQEAIDLFNDKRIHKRIGSKYILV